MPDRQTLASAAYRRAPAKPRTTISVCGELDIAMVPVVDRELRAAELAAPVVVLDLRSLEFVDSSGATLILSTARRMGRAGRRLVLARCSFEVRWLLALMGVDRELEFADAESLVHQQSDGGRHERRRACR